MEFSKLLIAWYLTHKRDLPWRETRDPYAIWLSEIILQQTRVSQGLPYYFAFIKHFPTLTDLADAPEQEVLKLWQGLGYYSRARNLQKTARYIISNRSGIFPKTYKELQELPGIGPYTAAAIASFAYKECVPAVDGNVFRVASRIFGITDDTALAKTRTVFASHLLPLMPKDTPDLFNQAMMEFGALVCLPKNPACSTCVFQSDCVAYLTNQVANLPVKTKKTKVRKRYLHYFWVQDQNGKYAMNLRSEKGIWQNLYELPLFESEVEDASSALEFAQTNWCDSLISIHAEKVVHQLSHQQLHIQFYYVQCSLPLKIGFSYEEVLELPVPIVLHNFIVEQAPLSKN